MQVLFDFLKQQIAIEGEELELVELLKLVRDIAPKIPAINIISQTTKVTPGDGPPNPSVNGTSGGSTNGHVSPPIQTMRQFVRSLDLTSNSEKIAAIAYYQKTRSLPPMSPKEMGDFFALCGFQKPTQMPVALFDAKRKYGFMESAGRGLWRITTQGENLILGKLEGQTIREN